MQVETESGVVRSQVQESLQSPKLGAVLSRDPSGTAALLTSDSRLLAFRMVRKEISVVISSQVHGDLLKQPQKTSTVPIPAMNLPPDSDTMVACFPVSSVFQQVFIKCLLCASNELRAEI